MPRKAQPNRRENSVINCVFSERGRSNQPIRMKWTIEGTQREALVYAPSKDSRAARAPLIFDFRWHGGSMQEAASA